MRFLVIPKLQEAYSSRSPLENALSNRGALRFDLKHAAVFVAGARTIQLDGGTGVIIGTLFDRSFRRVVEFTPSTQLEIVASRGAALIKSYWGNYIAVLAVSGETIIIRAPSCDVACNLYVSRRGARVSSEPAILLANEETLPAVDFDAIQLHLQAISLRPNRTAIRGITELLRGERLTAGSDGTTAIDAIWSPWDAALEARQNRHSSAEAASTIRDVAHGCVEALANASKVLLDLSGGLDSSIVAASLARAQVDFHCLNFRTSQPSGDERDFARLVARHFGAPLHEVALNIDDVDLYRSAAARLARPAARSFIQAWDVAASCILEETGASISFNGAGGDNVFCSLQSAAPVADRLLVGGVGPGIVRTASDLSILTGCSIWTALHRGVRRAWTPAAYRWPADRRFLAFRADPVVATRHHPWLAVPPRGLPGSAGHIAQLLQIENHLECFTRAEQGQMVYPLLAQPLVEACLRIPTWQWIEGGWNRSVARMAFREDLPPALLSRRGKGKPESFLVDLFEAKRAEIRDLLAGGVLASRGLLDIDAVLSCLDQEGPARSLEYTRILRLVDTEAWLRHWSSVSIAQLTTEALRSFERGPP